MEEKIRRNSQQMKNWGLIGQENTTDSLELSVRAGKIGNAYLFHGPAGSGKKSLAKVFAKAVNCVEKRGDKPCGNCPSCMKFENGNHPNIEWVKPDGASLKIRQIVQIVGDVSKKPYDSGYKVVVIEQAEKMTVDAQNAFLKTLEEPPPYTVFLILAENPKALLPTVVSRCQSFRMRPVPITDIQVFLSRTYPDREAQIKLASVFSNGIIGRSVQMLEQPDYFIKRQKSGEILTQLLKGRLTIGGDFEFYQNRAEADWFVELGLSVLRDCMVVSELGEMSRDNVLNTDLMTVVEGASGRLTTDKMLRITDILRRTSAYLKANVNIKGSMDAMLLNVLEVTHG